MQDLMAFWNTEQVIHRAHMYAEADKKCYLISVGLEVTFHDALTFNQAHLLKVEGL